MAIPTEVVLHSSEPPSPWAGYKACLQEPYHAASHVLVIQDDVQLCKNFSAVLPLIAQEVPVCLYVGEHSRQTVKHMRQSSERYVPIYWREFLPAVAVLWPVQKIREFLGWAEKASLPGEPNPRSDDAVLGYWMRKTRQVVLASVPSLVQHDDSQPSVKRANGEQRPQDSVRPAAMLAEDAENYDWTPSEPSVYAAHARRRRS